MGWSCVFHTARLAGKAPLALLFDVMTTKVALGAVVMRVPAMTDFKRSRVQLLRAGHRVRVDADLGLVSTWHAPL